MKNRIPLMTAAASLMLSSGLALGADKAPDCIKAGAPDMVEGQVTKVDASQGRLGLRANDGTVHEFQASRETLDAYKVGDPIKMKLRTGQKCD